MTSVGMWVNSSGEEVATPSTIKKTDSYAYLEPYMSTTKVVNEMKVDIVDLATSTQWNFLKNTGMSSSYELPETGSVTTSYIKDGKYTKATGTTDASGTITYGTPKTGSNLSSIWGHAADIDGQHLMPLVSEGISAILPYVSFSDKATSDGSTYYYFNTCGDDFNSEYAIASWTSGAIFGGITAWISYETENLLAANVEGILDVLFGRAGAEFYITNFFVVDSTSISIYRVLGYSSNAYYMTIAKWSDIGTTVLDSASEALLA